MVIPPLYANISFPDSSEVAIFKTDSSFVYISSVLDSTMTTVIDDKPLKEIQFPIERLRLFALFLLSILTVFALYLIRTRNNEKFSKRKFFNFNPKSNISLEIANSRSIDVLEIDGASNRGIEEIRSLREQIKFPPMNCNYKVIIIDEVHMLTNQAFNALLKASVSVGIFFDRLFTTKKIIKAITTKMIIKICKLLRE